MTAVSLAAQAIFDVLHDAHDDSPVEVVAAVLRAVAEVVAPDGHDFTHGSIAEIEWRGRRKAGAELRAIANELAPQP